MWQLITTYIILAITAVIILMRVVRIFTHRKSGCSCCQYGMDKNKNSGGCSASCPHCGTKQKKERGKDS